MRAAWVVAAFMIVWVALSVAMGWCMGDPTSDDRGMLCEVDCHASPCGPGYHCTGLNECSKDTATAGTGKS